MSFVHIWAIIAGAAAIGLPLAVHWLTRPRPQRVNFSAVRFVKEAVKQRQARHRLRDALILATRMLAVLCLALAFARPLLSAPAAQENAPAIERIVVLDVSSSMGTVANGVAALEKARGVAARYLEPASGLKANLVLAGARPRGVFERPSANLGALREELGQAHVRPERFDLAAALTMASEEFSRPTAAGAPTPRREVVLISDLQRSNWGAADFSTLPADCKIVLESVAPAQTLDNVAIVGVSVRAAGGGRPAAGEPGQADVEIANYSAAPRTVQVEIQLAGRTYHLEKLCPARAVTHATGPVAFAARGVSVGEARLESIEDALAADNVRSFVVDVHAAPSYLLLSREGADPQPTSSNYLERALDPAGGTGGTSGVRHTARVVRSTVQSLDPQVLAEADAVVLDRPGRLDGPTVAVLANWLRRGKSILYIASESVDATNLGALAQQEGSDLRMPVEFVPPTIGRSSTTQPAGGVRHNLSLAEVRQTDPIWSVFGDSLQQTIDSLRFTARLSSRPIEGGLADDLLATYSDRSAALIATACGQGTLLVWNADLAESNIVQSGAFVPLVAQLASRLSALRPEAAVDGGMPIALSLPPEIGNAADITIETPGPAAPDKGRVTQEHGALLWRLDAAEAAGVYRLMRNGQIVAAVAVAIPAEEADLSPLPADLLTGRLSGGRQITVHAAGMAQEGPDRAWVWLAALGAVALMMELVLLKLFRT
jgi:hypothetical protein